MSALTRTRPKQQLPRLAIVAIVAYLDLPADRFRLATLHRLPDHQTSSFRALHQLEFAEAAKREEVALLDRLWLYCRAQGFTPRGYASAIVYSANLEVLRWWRETAPDLLQEQAYRAIQEACRKGRDKVLEWWKSESRISPLPYDHTAMNSASSRGHLGVLQWWKESGFELRYTKDAIEFACIHGRLDVLQWWKDSGFELRYTKDAIQFACMKGRLDVLQWWKDSGLEPKYTKNVLDLTNDAVRQWWKSSGREL